MLSNLFNTYKQENDKLIKLKTTLNTKNMGINASILTLFILSAPLVLYSNFFVMYGLFNFTWFVIIFLLMIVSVIFLVRFFYYQQLKQTPDLAINFRFLLIYKTITDSLTYVLLPISVLILLQVFF